MNIEESFTKTEISNYESDPTTKYSCGCKEIINFKFHDFEKHWKINFSNLSKEHFVGGIEKTPFIDFYCPSCNIATTVQYTVAGGGQHGEFCFIIQKIVTNQSA